MYLSQHVTITIPLEEEKVQEIEVLGEEVSQDTVWVATFDLVGRQAKVDALHKVPDLGNMILVEPPVEQNWIGLRNRGIMIYDSFVNAHIFQTGPDLVMYLHALNEMNE